MFLIMQDEKSENSHGVISPASCEISHDMTDKPPNPLYLRLMRLKPAAWTEAEWARQAGVSSSYFQDLKKKIGSPRTDTLEKILGAVGTTMTQFEGARDDHPLAPIPPSNTVAAPQTSFRPFEAPKDVPVIGTAEGAELIIRADSKTAHVAQTIMETAEIIEFLRRPPGIIHRRDVYALYVVGTSMEPRFRPGDPIIIDPKRQPSIGDDVVVQLRHETDDGDSVVTNALVKTLERRGYNFIELRQYQPEMVFRVQMANVAAIHRVIPTSELLGF